MGAVDSDPIVIKDITLHSSIRGPNGEEGWMESMVERLQSFNTELSVLTENVQTVVERAHARSSHHAVSLEDPSPIASPPASMSKPLVVRVDETLTTLGEQISNLTENVTRLSRLV